MGNGGVCGFKSAVCERERSNLPGSHSFAPMAAAPTDSTQDAVDELRARPERTGMYFIVHRNTLLSAEYLDDPVEIAEEFFGRFTALNDQIQTLVKEFCAVKLDRELIRRQRERIRISSYRWDGVIRLGEGSALTYRIPTNFAWFLDWIKEREQLGWIDFIANIGVNVPVPEVLSYMGELYAYNVVIGEWQLGLRSLREAEQRGWIHQEMAYGTLDSDATDRLFTELRVLGEGLCSMDSKARELRCTARVDEAARSALTALMREGKAALGAYWDGVGPFARLLAARGYDAALAQDSPLRIFEDPDDGGGRFEGVTEQDYEQLFEARLGDLVSGVAFSHTEGLFRTDADRFEVLAPLMKTALNGSQLSSLHSPHDFLARFAPSILTAYLSRELTFEGDRDAACTSVARAVVERGGGDVDAATLLGGCWGAWLKQLSEQSEEVFHCEVLAQSTWVRGAQGEEEREREGGRERQEEEEGEGGEQSVVEIAGVRLRVLKRYPSPKAVNLSPYASMAAWSLGARLEEQHTHILDKHGRRVQLARCQPELQPVRFAGERPEHAEQRAFDAEGSWLQVLALLDVEGPAQRVRALFLFSPEDTPKSSRASSPSGRSDSDSEPAPADSDRATASLSLSDGHGL